MTTPASGPSQSRSSLSWLPMLLLVTMAAGCAGGVYLLLNAHHVLTLKVERGTVVKAFYATGTVRPPFEYPIKSKAQGTLVSLFAREGSIVKKSQVLATVDDRQLKLEVERTRAELEEAKQKAGSDAPEKTELVARLNEAQEQLEISNREFGRVNTMYQSQSASLPDMDLARRSKVQWTNTVAAYQSQIANWRISSQKSLVVAQAHYDTAEANLADTESRSPIDGVVLERYAEQGEVVALNQKLLLVANPNDLVMKAAVDEEDITRTHPGQKVIMQLYAYPETLMNGHAARIFPTSDPANKTYEVWVTFDNPPARLKCGMTAELNFIEQEKSGVLLAPTSAVMEGKVYRHHGGRRFEPVDVTIGIENLEKAELTSGISEGEEIALDAKQLAPIHLPQTQGPVVPTRAGDKKEAGN